MKNRLVKLKEHNMYVRIIALNLIFTLLFSSILLYNSHYLKGTVKQNVDQTNKSSLMDIAGNVDQQLTKLKQSMYSLGMDIDLVSLNKSNPETTGYRLMLNKFNHKLTELGRLLPFDSSVYVYFKDKGYVTSSDGSRELDLFYQKLRMQSPDFTCNCLHQIEDRESLQIYDRFITYAYRINNVGTIMVKINKSALEADLRKSAQVLNNIMWISTLQGETVAGNSLLSSDVRNKIQSGSPSVQIEDKKYTSIQVTLNDLNYTILYPESTLQQKIRNANQYNWLMFLIFFIIAVTFLIVSVTMYRPIKSTMNKLLTSNQSMMQTLDQQRTIMEQNALLRLASGTAQDVAPEMLHRLQAKYRGGYIVTCFIESCQGLGCENASRGLEQLLSQYHSVHKLLHRSDADTYLIYNLEPGRMDEDLNQILEALDTSDCFMMCGISGYMADVCSIHTAIQQSLEAIDHYPYDWSSSSHIAVYSSVSGAPSASIALSIDKEQELIAYVLKGNEGSLEQFFAGTVRNLTRQMTYQEIRTLYRYLNDLLNMIITSKKIKQAQTSGPQFPDLSMLHNPELMHENLLGKYQAIAALQVHQDTALYDRIVSFIDQNFESDLSLTVIADQFSITTVYLSSYFKKHSGYNITYYIMFVRIHEAVRRLQQHRHLTIKEIAGQVGYSSEKTFTRHFKKLFGTTPALYMKVPLDES